MHVISRLRGKEILLPWTEVIMEGTEMLRWQGHSEEASGIPSHHMEDGCPGESPRAVLCVGAQVLG